MLYTKLWVFAETPDNETKASAPNLPTAIVQQSAKNALASVKSWNSNVPHINAKRERYNEKAVKKGWALKPYVKEWEYKGSRHNLSYPLNKLTLYRRGDLTRFSTNVQSRRINIFHGLPDWFVQRYPKSQLQAGSVCIIKKKFFLHLVYKIEQPEVMPGTEVVGIDRGVNNIIATSRGELESSKHILAVKKRYRHNRQQLRQKGTRSAKRGLRRVSGREKRFMLDANHCITKRLASDTTVGTYVLEDLKHIRDERKGTALNTLLSNWAYGQFAFQLEYKCRVRGIEVKYTTQRYTSQKCSACTEIHDRSRYKETFCCMACGYVEHADINAAKNIRDQYLLGRIQPSNRVGASQAQSPSPCGWGS